MVNESLKIQCKANVTDRKFLEIIEKFLKVGIMENEKYHDIEQGTPQGNLCKSNTCEYLFALCIG